MSRGARTIHLVAILVAALSILLAAAPSHASAASEWQRAPESAVRMISAVTATGDLPSLPVGLEFDLAPGWKTYWRTPGEGGFPPKLDWAGSENVAGAEVAWPAPERFSILGIDSVGYAESVVLPISITLTEPGRPAHLRLTLDYLTCEEICIPQRADLDLPIPAGTAAPSGFAHLIDRYRGRVPGPPGPAMEIKAAEWVEAGGKPALRVAAVAEAPFRAPDLFIEGVESALWGRPVHASDASGLRAIFTVPRLDSDPRRGDSELPLVLTLVDGKRAVEQQVTVASGAGASLAAAPATAERGILAVLAIALLGGLILNLMPCVLPVLSIKVLGLVKHGGADASAARLSFLATSVGIVASFLMLAAAAAAVRTAGLAVGWGMQFQQPVFLVAMTLVLVLFAANLWGFYEIGTPRWLSGGAVAGDRGLSGPFLTGMLATALATPCSAPFVGTAVAYALSRGTAETFMIFAALGVGLALPYLAIAAFPRAATMLPRPGRWMAWLRRVLGFALLGTAIWLLSVLHAQTGALLTGTVAAISGSLVGLLWLERRAAPAFRAAAVGVLALAAIAAPIGLGTDRSSGPLAIADGRWAAFDQRGIERLVAEGRVVFVDVTADWCITCRVNKAAVLERQPVAARLFGSEIIQPMQADWTRPSDEIAAYLASFGRYGIPFNAVYGPGAPEGIALPELLSADAVLAAMDEAAGPPPSRLSAR